MKWIALVAVLACGCDEDTDAPVEVDWMQPGQDIIEECEDAIDEAQQQCGGEFYDLLPRFEDMCQSLWACGYLGDEFVECMADCYFCWEGDGAATYYGACQQACVDDHWIGVLDGCWTGAPL